MWDVEHSKTIAACVAGICMHVFVFIHGEWHLWVPRILFGHLTSFFAVFVLQSFAHDTSVVSTRSSLRLCAAYLLSLWSSIFIYRIFLHRTRKFPGPRLAAVTKLWHVWQSRNSTNFAVMQRMHEEYGEIVRTGPNEINIFRPDGIELLDGHKNTNIRDVWYDILHPRKALVFARNPEEIRALRGSWSQAVSSKCLNEYSARIIRLSDDLVTCIQKYAGKPVNVNDVMSWFSFDAMGEITFGEDFGMLKEQKSTNELIHQRTALALLAPLNDATWIAHLGFALFPFLGVIRGWWAAVRFCCSRMEKRMEIKPTKLDMSSFFIDEYWSTASTHSQSYRYNVLMGNSISAIVAGSDTTRASLIGIWYYLCKFPVHVVKIAEELENIDVNAVQTLASLPHLNAVIKETMRLAPPAMTGSPRITGPQGLWVGEQWIPGGVKVLASKYVTQRLPSAFQHPNDFIPERWTTRPELVLDARAYAPFSVGPHQCIGKAISHLEMRLVTAKIIKTFHVRFSSGYDPEAFWTHMKDQVTMMPGDMFCSFLEKA